MADVVLALQTLAKIDEMVYADQGAAFRQHLKPLMMEASDAYEGQKDPFRSHLGGSMIGRECPRQLWYNFRWAKAPMFPGQIIRLFNRGHLEEPRLVALMLMIGCEVWCQDENGSQFKVSYYGGHFGSAIDAVVSGCIEVPDQPILGEFKTHGDKSFKELAGSNWKKYLAYSQNPMLPAERFEGGGVKVAKFEHYVQMVLYMGYYSLKKAIYLAVNKDSDLLYAEIIDFDQAIYDMYVGRAGKIVFMNTGIPARISENSGFFKCKFCDFKPICHQGEPPARNCRTCAASCAVDTGEWQCITFEKYIDKKTQMAGCSEYDRKMEFKD